jgi:FKBP-type peptidyl-prolyl cis-trans isomerase
MIKQKAFLTLTIVLATTLFSCDKDETPTPDYQAILDSFLEDVDEVQLDTDVQLIDAYLSENSITAQTHESGLRYVIHEAGDGDSPKLSENITVNYEGSLLSNGETFDSGSNVTFPLYRLIASWQLALPLLNEGGSMTIYAPSGLCYGPVTIGSIPANSNLVFTFDLLDITK